MSYEQGRAGTGTTYELFLRAQNQQIKSSSVDFWANTTVLHIVYNLITMILLFDIVTYTTKIYRVNISPGCGKHLHHISAALGLGEDACGARGLLRNEVGVIS